MTAAASALYHEKQSLQMCAQHSLNNLMQGPKITKQALDEIAKQMAPDSLINPHKSLLCAPELPSHAWQRSGKL